MFQINEQDCFIAIFVFYGKCFDLLDIQHAAFAKNILVVFFLPEDLVDCDIQNINIAI